jgi:hypothetical protein
MRVIHSPRTQTNLAHSIYGVHSQNLFLEPSICNVCYTWSLATMQNPYLNPYLAPSIYRVHSQNAYLEPSISNQTRLILRT